MKRVSLFAVLLVVVPAVAWAQTPPPPPPPPPPVIAAPAAPPAAPLPPAPPVAPQVMMPATVDSWAIADAVQAARQASNAGWIDAQVVQQARAAADQVRQQVPSAQNLDSLRWQLADLQNGQFMTMGGSSESGNYNSGLSLEIQRQYDQAITRFDRVIAAKGAHADGALYHKAWCQAKLGKSDDAVATLAELKRDYSQSLYLKDARALEADVKRLGPSQVDDTDIKLLAIQGIMYQNPDVAVPAVEALLDKPTNSEQVRERALYVLATSDQPRAHQILLSYAKGGGNPDLQRVAIGYLANRGQKTSSADLIDIYNSNTNLDVRLAVIRAFRTAGAKGPLMSIAAGAGYGSGFGVASGSSTSSTNVVATGGRGGRGGAGGRGAAAGATDMSPQTVAKLAEQRVAIGGLADLASPQELWPLYQKEDNKDLRSEWVNTFSSMGAVDQLLEVVKTDKDSSVRLRAIRSLGNVKSDKTGPALAEMYTSGDKDTRSAVISALASQNNAESLVAIARKENDPELMREIVHDLADMAKSSPVAMNYLIELIKK